MRIHFRLFATFALLCVASGAASAQTLTITDSNYGNGVFSGTYVGTNSQPAITIATSKPVTITNCVVSGPGDLIYSYYSWNPNITITNTLGIGTNPNVSGQEKGRFVKIDGPEGVTIEHCTLESTGGIYLDDYKGDTSTNQTIRIRYNKVHNIDGRKSDGNNGYRNGNVDGTDFVHYCFVQLNHIGNNGPVNGVEIAWNEVVNDAYNSRVEDNINVAGGSSGTSGSPMQIHDNLIRGAFPAMPGAQYQQTFSGGGILLSDGGAGGASWVQGHDNVILGTTNYGIQINSGSNCAFWNNRVVASGLLPSGEKIWAMNVGAVLDQGSNNIAHQPGNVNVGNVIGWVIPGGTQYNGGSGNARNDSYFPENPDDYNHQLWWSPNNGSAPSGQDEANELQGWAQRLTNNGIVAGNNTLLNCDFETGDLRNWSVWPGSSGASGDATFAESYGGAQSGYFHGAQWKGSSYEVSTYQDINIPNGTYTLTAYVQNTGGQDQTTMEASNFDNNSSIIKQSLPVTQSWTPVTISPIYVQNGHCTVAFYSRDSRGGDWIRFDNVQLYDPLIKPAAPIGFNAAAGAAGTKKITLTWTASRGATSYKIYRSASGSGTYSLLGTSASPTYVNTGLTAGTTYYYKISAVNAAGESAQSGAASAKAQ